MKLVIAEKPSVAQSLAKVIGADKRQDGYLEGGGYLVSWCVGHLAVLSGKVKLQSRTVIRTENQYRSRAGSWLIDAEKKLPEKGPGYAQWAKRHNLKQVSKSFLFLRDQKIRGLSHLSSLVEEKTKARDEAQELLIAQSNIGSIYDFSDGKFRRQEEKEQKR